MIVPLIGYIFLGLYFLISLFALCIIDSKLKSNQSYVYYLSKIETIKNIIRQNHKSKLFYNINSTGYVEGLNINYRNLMKVIEKDGCSEGYKKCGILDTIGNILCIDEYFECPINKMSIDSISKQNKYLDNGFELTYSDNLFYNFRLYISRNFLEEKICVSLYRGEEKPNYISLNNFVLNVDAYRDKIGDIEESVLKKANDTESQSGFNIKDLSENILSLIFLYLNKEEDDRSEKMAKHGVNIIANIFSFITDDDKKKNKIKNFKKYVEENLKKEKNNIDIYYTHIGELVYSKSYIGFRNIEEIDIFMNFDFKSIYERIFPTRTTAIFSIIFSIIFGLVFYIWAITFLFVCLEYWDNNKKYENNYTTNENVNEKNSEKNIINNNSKEENGKKKNEDENRNENNTKKYNEKSNDKNNNENEEDKNNNKNNVDEKNSNGNKNGKINGSINNNENKIDIYKKKSIEKSYEISIENFNNEGESKEVIDKSKTKNQQTTEGKKKNYDIGYYIYLIIIGDIFSLVNLAFIIYSSIIYKKVNKNKTLNDLEVIESDEFINNFINEFISLCRNPLCLESIILFTISFSFLIISNILYCSGQWK